MKNVSGINPNTKYPLIYNLKIKRGVAWSSRRVELDRERIKYFKLEANELRFNENIDDCKLEEKHVDQMKKYYLVLSSKSGNFKDVKLSCADIKENKDELSGVNILKQFKIDFDFIQNYKSTITNIKDKTFFIESNRRGTNKTETETVHMSVIGDDNETTVAKSCLNEEDLVSNLYRDKVRGSKTLENEIEKQIVKEMGQENGNGIGNGNEKINEKENEKINENAKETYLEKEIINTDILKTQQNILQNFLQTEKAEINFKNLPPNNNLPVSKPPHTTTNVNMNLNNTPINE